MRLISIADLVIPENRQRKMFADKPLGELRESILSKGLLHPPVVQFDGAEYTLVCGERRTRAITTIAELEIPFQCDGKTIPPGMMPVILLSDLSPLDVREAELEENTIRENLSWQETAAAIAELHELRMEQAVAEGLPPPSAKSVATELKADGTPALGSQIQRVTEAVILSRHMEDPDVAKAKSQKEAMKVVRKKAEAAHRAVLAEKFDQSTTPHILLRGSAFELLPSLPSSHFDLILTDPPYGVGADTFGDMASTGHEYKDDIEYAMQCYSVLARQGFRVTKAIATLYAFCDIRRFPAIEMELTLAGWDVWPAPLIWNKLNGMLPKPDFGPRKTYEAIIMATKGNPHFLKTGAPDVLTFPLKEETNHGAQKPVDLYVELITRSALPGSAVLDPFSGSGTIFPAANKAKVIATGFEINPEYFNLGLSRMNETSTNPLEDLL
jgi:site-specific DNA-methyltransferase (adenine-specific)